MKRFTSIAALTALLITSAACGDASEQITDTTSAPESTAPGTTAAPDTTGVETEAPTAIVSLAPALTEMLFAIGAGPQVIAVDEYSNYPAEALEKPHDISGFEPNIEAKIGRAHV